MYGYQCFVDNEMVGWLCMYRDAAVSCTKTEYASCKKWKTRVSATKHLGKYSGMFRNIFPDGYLKVEFISDPLIMFFEDDDDDVMGTPLTVLPKQEDANIHYPYQPEQRVLISGSWLGSEDAVVGRIVGLSSSFNAYPVLGTIWIVELIKPLPNYSYRCITVPACHLQPLEPL